MAVDQDRDGINYVALAEFRYHIRKFIRFSERAARAAGVEPQQHQLLLAVKGMPDGVSPTIGEIASRLQVVHHSAVELVDRLEDQGLVQRRRNSEDRRQVFLPRTPKGERILRDLSVHHRRELAASGPELSNALRALISGPRENKKKIARPKNRTVRSY
jgi:DNA-binding MarR family transcriptional regulator